MFSSTDYANKFASFRRSPESKTIPTSIVSLNQQFEFVQTSGLHDFQIPTSAKLRNLVWTSTIFKDLDFGVPNSKNFKIERDFIKDQEIRKPLQLSEGETPKKNFKETTVKQKRCKSGKILPDISTPEVPKNLPEQKNLNLENQLPKSLVILPRPQSSKSVSKSRSASRPVSAKFSTFLRDGETVCVQRRAVSAEKRNAMVRKLSQLSKLSKADEKGSTNKIKRPESSLSSRNYDQDDQKMICEKNASKNVQETINNNNNNSAPKKITIPFPKISRIDVHVPLSVQESILRADCSKPSLKTAEDQDNHLVESEVPLESNFHHLSLPPVSEKNKKPMRKFKKLPQVEFLPSESVHVGNCGIFISTTAPSAFLIHRTQNANTEKRNFRNASVIDRNIDEMLPESDPAHSENSSRNDIFVKGISRPATAIKTHSLPYPWNTQTQPRVPKILKRKSILPPKQKRKKKKKKVKQKGIREKFKRLIDENLAVFPEALDDVSKEVESVALGPEISETLIENISFQQIQEVIQTDPQLPLTINPQIPETAIIGDLLVPEHIEETITTSNEPEPELGTKNERDVLLQSIPPPLIYALLRSIVKVEKMIILIQSQIRRYLVTKFIQFRLDLIVYCQRKYRQRYVRKNYLKLSALKKSDRNMTIAMKSFEKFDSKALISGNGAQNHQIHFYDLTSSEKLNPVRSRLIRYISNHNLEMKSALDSRLVNVTEERAEKWMEFSKVLSDARRVYDEDIYTLKRVKANEIRITSDVIREVQDGSGENKKQSRTIGKKKANKGRDLVQLTKLSLKLNVENILGVIDSFK
ncbi:hypothetical protein HK098_004170 [Nowakowskiella sp. JEL0407]|nr:hypothetical protein HK098_004170 [Nowakowskiella sp. JEL0407]